MPTEPIPIDAEQRVEELREIGFNVSFKILVFDSNEIGLVFMITKVNTKT